jgi:predicted Zn-dependent protease
MSVVSPRNAVLSIVALATVAAVAVLAIGGPPPPTALNWPAQESIAPSWAGRSPMPVPDPPVARNVYFAPIGDFPREKVEALITHYRAKYDLTIEVLAPISVPPDALNTERDQLGADRLLEAIRASDVALADPEAVIIGLTDQDMYIEDLTWRYAYAARSNNAQHAVISTARFNAYRADEAMQMQRLRKMISKNLGFLYYGLGSSQDPGSVMYGQIMGPDDLDAVSEDY